MTRISMLFAGVLVAACGGSTSEDLTGTGGGGSSGKGGTASGGTSSGGSATGGVGTGGVGTGGVGTGGVGTGGVGTGGVGTGGVGTGGAGTGGVGTGGVGTGGAGTGGVGTGGSGTGGVVGTGGTASTCSTVCQKIAGASCPNEDPYSACLAGCQIDVANYQAKCAGPTAGWMKCAMGPGKATCSTEGEAIILGCNAELTAFVQCAGCIPSTGDSACDACTKSSCCNELSAVYNHPQFSTYLSCVYACTSEACVNNCYFQSSGLQPAITALVQCQGAKCAAC